MIKAFLDSIKVHDVELTKIRVGNKNDGGYVALDEICRKTKAIYSYGVGDDIGFEVDFTNTYGALPVFLNDPTIEANFVDYPDFKFERQGIGEDYPVPKDFIQDSLLKMDVEWHEWNAIERLPESELVKFSQILIELHIIPVHGLEEGGYSPYFKGFHISIQDKLNQRLFAGYLEVINKLKKFFYIYHIHANNSLEKIELNGYSFPPLVELSLVRKDLIDVVREDWAEYPIKGLDFPNKTDRPDIQGVYPLGS